MIQVALVLGASALAALAYAGSPPVAALYLLGAAMAGFAAVQNVTAASIVPNLVAQERLRSALALNYGLSTLTQVVGPAGEHAPGTKEFRMPANCPLCGTPIVKPEGEAMHRCPNRACPSRGLESLINWTGVADIEGVGEQTIRILWDKGLVRSLPDLYRLTKEQLLELDGFGEISATAAIAVFLTATRSAMTSLATGPGSAKVMMAVASVISKVPSDICPAANAAAEPIAPTHPTLGDVDSPEALDEYQARKRAAKAAARKREPV